jgi:hypothetical protein
MLRKREKTLPSVNKGPGVISNFVCGRLEYRHVLCFIIYFTVISVLELMAYSGNSDVATWIASRIWLVGGVICIVILLVLFGNAVKTDFLQMKLISLIAITGIIIYLIWICTSVSAADVSPDATQQAAAGLNSFFTKNFNYTGKAFLGYPNRQYLLIALPALFFGRSIATLHIGFALPFIIGILTMYSGLRGWLDKKGINGSYAVIAVYAIFAFRFVTEYYINFEQAILPISLTMILIGLFLRLLCRPDAAGVFCIAWIGGLCSNCYTPALATLGLLLLLMGLFSVTLILAPRRLPFLLENRKQTTYILIMAIVNILIFYMATLLGVRADRVTRLREGIHYSSVIYKSILNFLTDKNAIFMGFMGLLVIVYLVAALSLRLKVYDLLISLWVLGVFVATNLLEGYTTYAEAAVMQRALVVIPVLIAGMFLAFCDFVKKHNLQMKNDILSVILFVLILIGRHNFAQTNQSFLYYNYIQPMKYMLEDLENTTDQLGLSHTDTFNYVIYTDNICFTNSADYFKFLYPKAIVYNAEKGAFPEGVDLSLPTVIYGDYNFTGMTPSGEIRMISYDNKRYEEQGYWYEESISK